MANTIVVAVVALVATAAAFYDLRWRRIPNWLTGTAALSGLIINTWSAGVDGLITALLGGALGLVLLLPFYARRGVGAGDVKLLAALGALVGPQTLVWIALFTGLVGGAMSLAVLARRGRLGSMLKQLVVLQMRPAASGLKAPYGVAIAGGAYLALAIAALG
jgi:prepilin peptidase CpaA